jgi:hypothetical protein
MPRIVSVEVGFFHLDNSVLAISTAVKNIVKDEADDYFVLVLSDANLNQYNINAQTLDQGKCGSRSSETGQPS